MHGSRLSAVHSVQRTPRFTGCCGCLSQPRRIRPIPFKSRDYDMVETRTRRRLRVIHLLPLKKSKATNSGNGNKTPAIPRNVTARLSFCDPDEIVSGNGSSLLTRDNSNKNGTVIFKADVVTAEIEKCQTSLRGGYRDYSEFDEYGKSDHEYNEQEEVEEETASEYAFPLCNFLPVYGFESPFHPKNCLDPDSDATIPLEVFADYLVHRILDDAFHELEVHHGLLLSVRENEVLERGTMRDGTYDLENVHSGCYGFNSDSKSDGWPSCTCQPSGNLDKVLEKLSTWCAPNLNGWEQGHDNPTFQRSSDSFSHKGNAVDNLMVNGNHHVVDIDYPATSTAYLPKSSFRISRRGLKPAFGARTNSNASIIPHWSVGDDGDGSIDPFAKFTYHPTGDDTCSQPDSSFQSSTWGSSTASSMRYIRRFTSKKCKAKPLLMFIHGIGDSADLWRNQIVFFKEKGYETVSMDLIGHGLSCAPKDSKAYTFHAILTDVLVVFDRYSKERNVVIGHSYGACFAAALSRHRPKQVTHLILLSGGGPFPLYPQPAKVRLPNCITQCFQSLSACGTRRKTFYVPSRKQTRLIRNLDIPSYVLKYMTKGQVWLEGDASFHKQITIPTLLVYGLKDPFVTLVEECEMEKTIPRAFLELIPEASHMIMLDAPDQVNDMIYKFLRRWNR